MTECACACVIYTRTHAYAQWVFALHKILLTKNKYKCSPFSCGFFLSMLETSTFVELQQNTTYIPVNVNICEASHLAHKYQTERGREREETDRQRQTTHMHTEAHRQTQTQRQTHMDRHKHKGMHRHRKTNRQMDRQLTDKTETDTERAQKSKD